MAKRRFVYGQGVGEIDFYNPVYKNETTLFDYSNAQYATNFIYPDMNRWRDALAINIDTSSSYISPIDYDLPEFESNSSTLYTEWLAGNEQANINNPDTYDYFIMNPPSASGLAGPSLFYDSINILNENLSAILGVFKKNNSSGSPQPLMKFNNKATNELFEILIDPNDLTIDGGTSSTSTFEELLSYGSASTIFLETEDLGLSETILDGTLKYKYTSYDGQETIIYQEKIIGGEYFNAGIDIDNLEENYHEIIGNFFSSLDNISLTIGSDGENTFLGNIYIVHFTNSFTYEKDLQSFFSGGTVLQELSGSPIYTNIINHTSSYSLLPISGSCGFSLDIGISGYWEDMQPLSYFGKYVYDQSGNKYYDLDLIQLNIDCPRSIAKQYTAYDHLSQGIETSVRSYVTFKYFEDAINKQYSSFTNTEQIPNNFVIEFKGNEYEDTKYEFCDKVIIIPPEDDFENYYLGLHLEIKIRGIKTKSFILRRLELCSLAFNDNLPTPIGSRYSEEIIPFTRGGNTFNYKTANPLSIYKDSSPFLYLTDDSGLMCNIFDVSASTTRGFYSNINKDEEEQYILGAFQTWIRYPNSSIGNENIPLFSIIKENKNINFYIEPEVGQQRGFIYGYDSATANKIENIVFFQDGKVVDSPVIYPKKWTSINISFLDPLLFNNFNGRIEFYENILFNNITKYIYSNNAVNTFKEIFSKWYEVFYNAQNSPPVNTWGETLSSDGNVTYNTWRKATSRLQSNQYTINGEQIYNNQTGLSISVTDDNSRLSIASNGADIMTEVVWQTIEKSPV